MPPDDQFQFQGATGHLRSYHLGQLGRLPPFPRQDQCLRHGEMRTPGARSLNGGVGSLHGGGQQGLGGSFVSQACSAKAERPRVRHVSCTRALPQGRQSVAAGWRPRRASQPELRRRRQAEHGDRLDAGGQDLFRARRHRGQQSPPHRLAHSSAQGRVNEHDLDVIQGAILVQPL
jgi:hypothetical protein